MSEARGHHYISQCYLKRFTNNGGKNSRLQVYDLSSGAAFATVPRNVAKQRDFNLIEGLPAGELDRRLSVFEGEVEKALTRIEQARNLQDHDAWICVLNLASLFAVRNPRLRGKMSAFYDEILRKVMDLALATPEDWDSQMTQAAAAGYIKADRGITYEQMKDFHERGQYTIEMANAMHIGAEFHTFEPVLRTMVDRKWILFIADPDSTGFITSDHPACLVEMASHISGIYGVGFGMRETMVVFPASIASNCQLEPRCPLKISNQSPRQSATLTYGGALLRAFGYMQIAVAYQEQALGISFRVPVAHQTQPPRNLRPKRLRKVKRLVHVSSNGRAGRGARLCTAGHSRCDRVT